MALHNTQKLNSKADVRSGIGCSEQRRKKLRFS